MRDARARFGGNVIPREDFIFEIMKWSGEPRAYALVADQTPKRHETQHWTRFLNQDTAFFIGAGKIANFLQAPVLYVAMRRIRRGYYSVRLSILAEPPYEEGTDVLISERYARIAGSGDPGEPVGLAMAAEEVEVPEGCRTNTTAQSPRLSVPRCHLAGEVAGHGAHRRIFEEVRDFEPAGIRRFDLFVDLRQRQRTGP